MTTQEELFQLKERLAYLEEKIQEEKNNKIKEMIEDLCGKYITFKYNDEMIFAHVLGIEGCTLRINSFSFTEFGLESRNNELVSTKIKFFDIDSLKVKSRKEFDRMAISYFEKYILDYVDR